MGTFDLAFSTPTHMGDHKCLERAGALMEEEWKWRLLR